MNKNKKTKKKKVKNKKKKKKKTRSFVYQNRYIYLCARNNYCSDNKRIYKVLINKGYHGIR